MLDLRQLFQRAGAVPHGIQRHGELACLRGRHPRLVADAARAETRHHEGVPASLEPVRGGAAPDRPAEHRVIPVHRVPALVGERFRMAGHRVPELIGREFPVRLPFAQVVGERDRAAQALVDARAGGQQCVVIGGPARMATPDDLTARGLQADRELDAGPHHGPHQLGERVIAGHEQLVPDAHGRVRGVVALGRPVRHGASGGPFRPGAVTELGVAEPVITAPGWSTQPADAQRHRALDVVPGVDMTIRPADPSVGLLNRRNALTGRQYLVGREDPRYFRQQVPGARPRLRPRHRPALSRRRHGAGPSQAPLPLASCNRCPTRGSRHLPAAVRPG